MKIVYIANDGTQFDNQYECENYEWELRHPYLNHITIFDKYGNELTDIFSEKTYSSCDTIIILNEKILKDLQDLAAYTGYCLYSDINKVGVWEYKDNDNCFVLKES